MADQSHIEKVLRAWIQSLSTEDVCRIRAHWTTVEAVYPGDLIVQRKVIKAVGSPGGGEDVHRRACHARSEIVIMVDYVDIYH